MTRCKAHRCSTGLASPSRSPTSANLNIPQVVTPWEPTEFIFNCPVTLTNSLQMLAPPFPGYQDYGDRLTANSIGLEWGGYTIDPTEDQAGIVARDDGRSVTAGFIVSTVNHDDNANGQPDGVDLFENMIKWGNPPIPWGDVPWLGETPLNGTVGPTSQFSATLTFTTTGLAPGTYVGYLFGLSNDPNAIRKQIQVTLTVCPGQCAGGDFAVTDVTLNGYGTSRPVVGVPNQVAVTVKNVGSQPAPVPANYLYVECQQHIDPSPSPPISTTTTPYFGVVPGGRCCPARVWWLISPGCRPRQGTTSCGPG